MCYFAHFNGFVDDRTTKIQSVISAGGAEEAGVLVYLGHLGGVACAGLTRSADPMESHCRGIFSHRG